MYRLLRSLVDAGVLEQDERTTRYRLGTGLASLAEVFLRQRRLDLAEPELRRLSDEARGSAGLAMRAGRDALILVYAPTHLPSSTAASRPRRVPLHLSAMGKVLLAFGDPDDSGGVDALGASGHADVPIDRHAGCAQARARRGAPAGLGRVES